MLHRLLNGLILLPDRYAYQTPADLGLLAEDVTFPNAQGQALSGWFLQPEGVGDDAPVVLFCPGTSGNVSAHLYYVELLYRAGCRVLAFDYTGFGRSQGQASLTALFTDVLRACDFLRQDKGAERLGIFGVSIGANIALLAAAQRPEIGAVAVEGLALYQELVHDILQHGVMGPRSVTSITYEGRQQPSRAPHIVNPWRMPGWLAQGFCQIGVKRFRFAGKDPRAPARTLVDTPVLCIHGVEDPLLPFEAAAQVYDALPGAKRLWLLPGVSHAQEPILAQDGEYVAQLRDFFHGALQGEGGGSSILCEAVRQDTGTSGLRLRNLGSPCLALATFVSEQHLAQRTVWLSQEALVPGSIGDASVVTSGLRLFAVAGEGEAAHIRLTSRGQRYRTTFQPLIRELSRILHEGKLQELDTLLEALPQARPEAPFDFFLGLYCLQIMRRTQRKWPHLARAAAEAFVRYWHYGAGAEMSGQPTPWDVASAVLGRQVRDGECGVRNAECGM